MLFTGNNRSNLILEELSVPKTNYLDSSYFGLKESSLKYLGASHQNPSYKSVEFVVRIETCFP